MNNKTIYTRGVIALLLFLLLAVWVLVSPASLTAIDSGLQASLRGDLPSLATAFFSKITLLFNTSIVVVWVFILAIILFFKKKKRSALFLIGNLVLSGVLIVILKHIVQRPRPAIQHLVEETGFSFPSGHSLSATLVCGALILLVGLSFKQASTKRLVQWLLALLVLIILVSRVYVGVHYPSDVTAGCLLGIALLHFEAPKLTAWLRKEY